MSEEPKESAMFERETAVYNAKKDELLKTATGQFVAIFGDKLIGPYPSYQDAYREGIRTFGNVQIFIKRILPEEPIVQSPTFSISRANTNFTCRYSP